jgi:glucuronate isomerase
LQEYGTHPNLHLILLCVDETAVGRDIAPLAGFYSSVFVGVPWWFIDAPYALQRFRESTIETVGFYKGSGFIDDTRAFLSIPARHDMARRVDAGVLAKLVDTERITIEEALKIAVDLVTTIPTRAFKL